MPYDASNVVDQREVMRLVLAELDKIEAEHAQVRILRPTDDDPETAEDEASVFIRLVSIDHAPDINQPPTDRLTITIHATCTAAQLTRDPGTLAWAASRIRVQMDNARGMQAATDPTHRVEPSWAGTRNVALEPQAGRLIRAVELVYSGKATRTAGTTLGDPFAA